MAREVEFVKGHGTRNDFIIIPDDDDLLTIDARNVAYLCDRRAGLGADGLLRVVKNANPADAAYFMDYRNADGSLAEMCGNGARVFARYLIASGREEGAEFTINTRSGIVGIELHDDGSISVKMGHVQLVDVHAQVEVQGVAQPALAITAPNPHAVVFVDAVEQAGDLLSAPLITPREAFSDGVNVEFVRILEPGTAHMRVYERGVGETQSCGTGACAAAFAAVRTTGFRGPWRIQVPGGELIVSFDESGAVDLRGPAELVARGSVLLP